MTNRELTSIITNNLKSLNVDDYISPKFIVKNAQTIVANFLKKENASKKVWKLKEGWVNIPCLPMEEVSISECPQIDTYLCSKLMKSKYPIPELFSSNVGSFIRDVYSLNGSQSYDNIFYIRQWNNTQKREYNSKKYYFFKDNYLYIPIPKGQLSSPEAITLDVLPINKWEIDALNSYKTCTDCNQTVPCQKPLDSEFICPSYILDDVKKEVLAQLAGVYLKVTPDNLPDLNTLKKTN